MRGFVKNVILAVFFDYFFLRIFQCFD